MVAYDFVIEAKFLGFEPTDSDVHKSELQEIIYLQTEF
jgi:hypothetical protein